MAINSIWTFAFLLVTATTWSREAASPAACQAAASQPPVDAAKAAADRAPNDLRARFRLADAWSDAGCFNESLQVLQSAQSLHSTSKELETRLRVAKSLVGEEHFFDNLDRASASAKLKRESFRCSTLADLDACNEAVRLNPDDPVMLAAQGDGLLRAKRPAEALSRYRRAASLAPNQSDLAKKITLAEAQLPPPVSTGSPMVANMVDVLPARSSSVESTQRMAVRKLRVASVRSTVPIRQFSNAAVESRTH